MCHGCLVKGAYEDPLRITGQTVSVDGPVSGPGAVITAVGQD